MTLSADLKSEPSGVNGPTNRSPTAVWDSNYRTTVGFGYRDNVTSSSVAPESSTFLSATADASFIRLSETGALFTLLFLGEEMHYFDAASVDNEQVFSASTQLALPLGTQDTLGSYLLYLYQNQVFDVSDSYTNLNRVFVQAQSISARPYWEHAFARSWSMRLEGAMLREIYASQLDSFWEGGASLSLIRNYGRRSELSLSYLSRHRFYDTRKQVDSDGYSINGTSLVYWQQEVSARWRHYWDADRHWRTTSRVSALFNRDNGSGYYDYDRIRFRQQLRWANDGWEITGGGNFVWHFHGNQYVEGDPRQRSVYTLDFRLERKLGQYWLLYAEAERQWSLSNDSLDQYNDWSASGGIGMEF